VAASRNTPGQRGKWVRTFAELRRPPGMMQQGFALVATVEVSAEES